MKTNPNRKKAPQKTPEGLLPIALQPPPPQLTSADTGLPVPKPVGPDAEAPETSKEQQRRQQHEEKRLQADTRSRQPNVISEKSNMKRQQKQMHKQSS